MQEKEKEEKEKPKKEEVKVAKPETKKAVAEKKKKSTAQVSNVIFGIGFFLFVTSHIASIVTDTVLSCNL